MIEGTIKAEIAAELYKALEKLGAGAELLDMQGRRSLTLLHIPASSNGRTPPFDGVNRGSNP